MCFYERLCTIGWFSYSGCVPTKNTCCKHIQYTQSSSYKSTPPICTVIVDSFLTVPIDMRPATSLTTLPWFIRLRVMKSNPSHKPSSPSSPPCSSPRQGNPPASSPRLRAKVNRTPRSSHRKSVNFHSPKAPSWICCAEHSPTSQQP